MTASEELSTPSNLAPNGVVFISDFKLLYLLASIVVVLIISMYFSLHLEKRLLVATTRCFIQLTMLSLILVPILAWNNPVLVLLYILFMLTIGAVEVSSRPPYFFDSLPLIAFVSLSSSVVVFGGFTFFLVLGTGLDAQYAIPIVGMFTGSAMIAVSLCISSVVSTMAERKESIELLLALGATRWEASIETMRSSIITSLIPNFTILAVTGLVSIPGMMTGQIIGGTPPSLAAKYQLVILYIGTGSSTVATLIAAVLTTNALIDSQFRVRAEKLIPRDHVNRIDAIAAAFRVFILFLNPRRNPFLDQPQLSVPRIDEQLPQQQTSSDSLSKTGDEAGYGATSAKR